MSLAVQPTSQSLSVNVNVYALLRSLLEAAMHIE